MFFVLNLNSNGAAFGCQDMNAIRLGANEIYGHTKQLDVPLSGPKASGVSPVG